jgi:hypothetical protein
LKILDDTGASPLIFRLRPASGRSTLLDRSLRNKLLAVFAGAMALSAGPAQALDNDLDLSRLCRDYDPQNGGASPCGRTIRPDQQAFSDLMREMGMAFAPRLLQPAETLGINGFQFDLGFSATSINSDKDYWQQGISDGTPPGSLMTMMLDMRKGLPYSLEIGANASYLIDSEQWAIGGSLKWAINEAVDQFPVDVAIRGSANHLVGSAQYALTTVGLDAILSRSFGAGGIANIGPYLAYSPLFIFARSGVVDATPGTPDDADGSFTFSGEDLVVHRFIIGSRFIFGAFMITPELALTQGMQQYNVNLGLDF